MPDAFSRNEMMPKTADTSTEQRAEKQPAGAEHKVIDIDSLRSRLAAVRREAPPQDPAAQLQRLQAKYAEDYAAYEAETDPSDKAAMAENLHNTYARLQALQAKVGEGAQMYSFPSGEKTNPESALLSNAQSQQAAAEAALAQKTKALGGKFFGPGTPGYSMNEIKQMTAAESKVAVQSKQDTAKAEIASEAAGIASKLESMVSGWMKNRSAEEFDYMMTRPPEDIVRLYAMQGGQFDQKPSSEAIAVAMQKLAEKYKK